MRGRGWCRVGLAVLGVLGGLGCARAGSGALPPARETVVDESLPEVFDAVGWASTEAQLRARFPEARVSTHEFGDMPGVNGRALTLDLSGVQLPPFGIARVRVMHREGHPTGVLAIERLDHPAMSCPADSEGFTACWEEVRRARRTLFDTLAKQLEQRYGAPSVDPSFGTDASEGQDQDPYTLRWRRPGYTLELGTGLDPSVHSVWTVRLAAIRDLEFPFL